MMETTWKEIIEEFLNTYVDKSTLTGVLITGSYAKNMQHAGSDLDVFLVTKNNAKTRMRGNLIIRGVMVEYYINSFKQITKYFETDKDHYNPMIYFSVLEGKIIFEKYGVLTKLKNLASMWMTKPFPEMKHTSVDFAKYVIADNLNKMKSLHRKKSDSFTFSYYINLKSIYESYAKYLRQPVLKEYMLADYFSKNRRFSDILRNFPDKIFSSLFHAALITKADNEKIKLYIEISEHVLSSMGGFKLDGWSLSLPVDYSNKRDIRSRVF